MIDFNLKPCPLCGGEARLEWLQEGQAVLDASICCTRCGLRLEWRTEFYRATALSVDPGRVFFLKESLDPFEAWNRRIKED